MQQDPSLPPGTPDRARRRGLFQGKHEPATPPTLTSALPPMAAERVEAAMGSYQAVIQEQLDEGLRAIQNTANTLMHEIAGEVWRTAGGDKEEIRAKILSDLSQDQAIRSLITHSDERFQALAVRTARLEDTMNLLAEAVRGAREQIARSVDALQDLQGGGAGVDTGQLRSELAQIAKQIAASVGVLADRDQAIVESVRGRVQEHGELVVQEMGRISHAMESYVQHGVEAMGQLAGNMGAQIEAIETRDEQISVRMKDTVEEQMRLLGEQLQLMYERMAVDTTSLHESVAHVADASEQRTRYLELMYERIAVQGREVVELVNQTVESRVMGLARMVRSDAEALRGEFARRAEGNDEAFVRILDERLGRVTEVVADATTMLADQLARRIREESGAAIRDRLHDTVTRLESKSDEQSRLIDERMDQAVAAIDRNMLKMTDSVEATFERLGRAAGEHAAQAADLAIGSRFDAVLGRLGQATDSVEQAGSDIRSAVAREGQTAGTQARELLGGIEERHREAQASLTRTVDDRVASIAKLIRSDNETLAGQIVADQEASKQALRAMKELQANLPAEVIETIEERFVSLAESLERSNEMLSKRIDNMAETIGKRQGDDIQVVIDRMGDAMHALASLGREGKAAAPGPRIELE